MKKHIAVVAPIGAGKTSFSRYFLKKGLELYKLSYALYEEVEKRGMDKEDRVVLQDVGDQMRKIGGPSVLADIAIKNIKRYPDKRFVIESIRNHNELKTLKDEFGEDLLILALDAPLKLRYERILKREGQYKEQEMSFEEFEAINKRDLGIGNAPNEQNVAKCLEMAEETIVNDGTREDLEQKVISIYNKYFT